MLILRTLTFSTDPTTQSAQPRTANMLKTYMATLHDQANRLRKHVLKHGTPPVVPGVEAMVSIARSAGIERLGTIDGPSIYEACLTILFNMVVEVNATTQTQEMGTQAAWRPTARPNQGRATPTPWCSVIEEPEDAWQALCQVYGTQSPKTDHARLTKLLRLCEAYQCHDKTKRNLIKQLRLIEKTIKIVPYTLAATTVEASVTAIDEIEAQMDKTPTPNKGDNEARQNRVNMVGTSACCPICSKAEHVARDSLIFMQNEGTMAGCRYGNMKVLQ